MEVKKMSFVQLLEDITSEETVRQQMIAWYNGQLKLRSRKANAQHWLLAYTSHY
jgi:hypothetical protein